MNTETISLLRGILEDPKAYRLNAEEVAALVDAVNRLSKQAQIRALAQAAVSAFDTDPNWARPETVDAMFKLGAAL